MLEEYFLLVGNMYVDIPSNITIYTIANITCILLFLKHDKKNSLIHVCIRNQFSIENLNENRFSCLCDFRPLV